MVYDMPQYSRLSQVPGTSEYHTARSYIPGQGFIHVTDQVGTYSEWMDGGPERKALFNAQMAAAHEYTYPYRIGATGPVDYSRSYEGMLAAATEEHHAKTAGTTASRSAGTGIAAGGTALARGGPTLGVAPGGGLNLSQGIGLSSGAIGSSITSAGNSAISMVTPYIPLATKVVLAVVALKIVLWLVRKK